MERSPAASTAVAIADAVKSLVDPTHEHDCFSSAVCTDGNPYGIHEGLFCSMPCWSEVSKLCKHMLLGDTQDLRLLQAQSRCLSCRAGGDTLRLSERSIALTEAWHHEYESWQAAV